MEEVQEDLELALRLTSTNHRMTENETYDLSKEIQIRIGAPDQDTLYTVFDSFHGLPTVFIEFNTLEQRAAALAENDMPVQEFSIIITPVGEEHTSAPLTDILNETAEDYDRAATDPSVITRNHQKSGNSDHASGHTVIHQ